MSEIIVDLFAGGGGASEGIRQATGYHPDVAINHDRIAIAMHKTNHPDTWHLIQNIRDVPPRWATKRRPVGLLWASHDCNHFSKAKGKALKRNREILSLAWVVEKWARETSPRIIILENVEEFKTWGPLDKNGRIIPSQKGATFRSFLKRLKRLGYEIEHKELRASDFGAPTIRKRFFLIARCDGMPFVWPEPTHGPNESGLTPYRTASEIIDWSLPCPSIFERKKPLVENTLKRIAEGIRRYVIETDNPFIVSPKHLKTTKNRRPVIIPHIQRQFGNSIGNDARDPVGTITAGGSGKTALVTAFLAKHYSGVIGYNQGPP